jgi:hypothetical protein
MTHGIVSIVSVLLSSSSCGACHSQAFTFRRGSLSAVAGLCRRGSLSQACHRSVFGDTTSHLTIAVINVAGWDR